MTSRRRLIQSDALGEGETCEVPLQAPGEDPRSLLLVRLNGTVHGYRNSCPHLRIPLNWQPNRFWNIEKTALICSLHGALFAPDSGECLEGPCVGRFLERVTIEEEDDALWLA